MNIDSHRRFEEALELGTRLLNDWHGLNKRMADTIAVLAAAAYDTEPGDTVVWCWEHEQSVNACAKQEYYCAGEPTARFTDPTGNAAVSTRAYEDGGRFTGHARRAAHHIEQMATIAQRYKPEDPQLTLDVEQENTKPDGCELCAKSDKWVPIHVEAANPNGVLRKPIRACRWHFDFIAVHGRIPDEREEAIHQAGGRVTVRATKQMDRLRRGLKTGAL